MDRGKEGQGKAMYDILNRLKQVDGRMGSGRVNERTKLESYKGQEEVENHDCLYPEGTAHERIFIMHFWNVFVIEISSFPTCF